MPWISRRISLGHGAIRRLGKSLAALSILLLAAGAGAQSQPPLPPIPPAAPAKPDLPPIPVPQSNSPEIQPAFSVIIDAAHGGTDTGSRITAPSGIPWMEKDITLELTGRLRSELGARGIAVVSTRQSDSDLPFAQRAGTANHAFASACLVLHATGTGTGVHLYTSSLAPATATPPAPAASPASLSPLSLAPWHSAQAAWITRSLRLSSEINSALGQAGIPTTLGVASVRPLDNLSCPAVAIELSPLAASSANKAQLISDTNYQQRILDALTAALLEWRTEWKQQP